MDRRFNIRVAVVSAAISLALLPASATALTPDTSTRSAAQLRGVWQSAQPTFSGAPYAVSPLTSAPFSAGQLNGAVLNDGLKMLNFARYLSGLPSDVTLDPTLSSRTQHGSVLLAANNALSHYPPQPGGMSSSFYDTGKLGTSSSNLAWGPDTLHRSIVLYMDDSDAGNIAKLGHRRWILNPQMGKTGMGMAGRFSAMWAFDRSRSSVVSYDAVLWPAAGPFPVQFFDKGTAWSASLNPSRYSVDPTGLVVTLRRVGDGATWTLTSADQIGSSRPFDGELFSYDSAGYGIPSCIIFRPPLDVMYSVGDTFEVTIGGTLYVRGTSTRTSVTYRTTFMSLTEGPVLPGSTVTLGAPGSVTHASPVALGAQLLCTSGKPLANRLVVFERSVDGGRSWNVVGSDTTDASGAASAGWNPTITAPQTRVRARFLGDSGNLESQQTKSVTVRPVLAVAPPAVARRGVAFGVGGQMRPRHAVGAYAGTVKCYKRVNGRWVYKTQFRAKVVANTTTASRVRASARLGAGTWLVKLYHPADSQHVGSISAGKTLVVR